MSICFGHPQSACVPNSQSPTQLAEFPEPDLRERPPPMAPWRVRTGVAEQFEHASPSTADRPLSPRSKAPAFWLGRRSGRAVSRNGCRGANPSRRQAWEKAERPEVTTRAVRSMCRAGVK